MLADTKSRVLFVGSGGADVDALHLPPAGGSLAKAAQEPQPPSPVSRHHMHADPASQTCKASKHIVFAEPILRLPGHAPLQRFAVFDDKRHVLTLDAAGVVGLWDVVHAKHVKNCAPGTVCSILCSCHDSTVHDQTCVSVLSVQSTDGMCALSLRYHLSASLLGFWYM